MNPPTTKHIQHLVGKMQCEKFHSPVIENAKDFINSWEQDILSISKSGMIWEFEVKISRADFKADLKKKARYYNINGITLTKHQFYADPQNFKSTPNYYSYVCPDGLIKLAELPSAAGLYYVIGDAIVEQRKPKQLHKNIRDRVRIVEKACRLTSERQFLGGSRMTVKNREGTEAWDRRLKKDMWDTLKATHDKLIEIAQRDGMTEELWNMLFRTNVLLNDNNKTDVDVYILFNDWLLKR